MANNRSDLSSVKLLLAGGVVAVVFFFLGRMTALPVPVALPKITILSPLKMNAATQTPVISALETQVIPSVSAPSITQAASGIQVLAVQGMVQYRQPPDGVEKPVDQGTMLLPGVQVAVSAGGMARLSLAGESKLALDGGASLRLPSEQGAGETVFLEQGSLLLVGGDVYVRVAQHEFMARGVDAVMGISHQPSLGQFQVDCMSGACWLNERMLRVGLRWGFDKDLLQREIPVHYETWLRLQDRYGGREVPLPTAIPEPTAYSTATPTVTPSVLPTVRSAGTDSSDDPNNGRLPPGHGDGGNSGGNDGGGGGGSAPP